MNTTIKYSSFFLLSLLFFFVLSPLQNKAHADVSINEFSISTILDNLPLANSTHSYIRQIYGSSKKKKQTAIFLPFPFFIFGIINLIFFSILRYGVFIYLGLVSPQSLKFNAIYSFLILGFIFITYGILLKIINPVKSKKTFSFIFNVISILLIILFIGGVLMLCGLLIESFQNYQFLQMHPGMPSE